MGGLGSGFGSDDPRDLTLWDNLFTFYPYSFNGLARGLPEPDERLNHPWDVKYFPELIAFQIKKGPYEGKWVICERDNFASNNGNCQLSWGNGWVRADDAEKALREFLKQTGVT